MDKILIHYKTQKEDYFKSHDIQARYYLRLDLEKKVVEWFHYLPLPKGMHWKAGDQMGGLGCEHFSKDQSFEEFIEKPQFELPKKEHDEALKHIKYFINLEE